MSGDDRFDALVMDGLGLGPLEVKVLGLLWDEGGALTVRQVRLALPALAYTTLMTTLDRLFRKRAVLRSRQGRAFAYRPRCSRSDLLAEMMHGQVTDLLAASGASTAILSTLVRAVGDRDSALLDRLESLVRAESARLKMEEK
jgi:predicted transcriptional regulator